MSQADREQGLSPADIRKIVFDTTGLTEALKSETALESGLRAARTLDDWKHGTDAQREVAAGHVRNVIRPLIAAGASASVVMIHPRCDEALLGKFVEVVKGSTGASNVYVGQVEEATFAGAEEPTRYLKYVSATGDNAWIGERRLDAGNGVTGEVQGQRPYSKVKIALAVIGALAVAAILYAVFGRS